MAESISGLLVQCCLGNRKFRLVLIMENRMRTVLLSLWGFRPKRSERLSKYQMIEIAFKVFIQFTNYHKAWIRVLVPAYENAL